LALAVVATLVLVIGLLVVKDRVLEEYYLSRLEATDPDACASAAWNLGRLGSLRAVPRLLWGDSEATWHARQIGLAWILLQRPAAAGPP